MIIKLLLALLAFILLIVCINKYKSLPSHKKRQVLLQWMLIAAATVLIIAVVTGRMHWIGALLAAALGFAKFGLTTVMRALPFLNFMRKQSVFANPVFKTPYIEVQINLQSGQVSGIIVAGPHEGTSIADLTDENLTELEKFYKDKDTRSYYLIRAIRHRSRPENQQSSNKQQEGSHFNAHQPNLEEALQILGLPANPTKEDVIKAHRSLMQKLHPDRGGNDYLASQINNAKEIILKHLEK